MERIKRFLKEEEGVTSIEYGIIASLIAVAIVSTVRLIGTNLNVAYNKVASNIK